MKLLSVTQLMRLFVIAVGLALAISVWACETAEPTPVEPSPEVTPIVRVEPTVEPTPEPTAPPQTTPTSTPTPTQTPEPSPTSTRVPTNTPEPTATVTPAPTRTPTPTVVAPTSTPTNTPEPTQTPSPTTTSEPEPTPTSQPTQSPTAEPTVTSTPVPEVMIEDEELTVDDETLWSEYFETLDEAETSCIHSALDDDNYDEMLERKVVSGQRVTDRHELAIWSCLTQENAIDLYLSAFYTFTPDGDRTDDELAEIDACHRSLLQYVDFARYLESSVTDIHVVHEWYVPRNLTLTSHSMVQCWFKEKSGYVPYLTFPVYEARPINFVDGDRTGSSADDISVWADGLGGLSEEEHDCIRDEIGPDAYESLLGKTIFDGETEPSEVGIWECLGKESAVNFLKRTAAFDFVSRFEFFHRTDERFGRHSVRDEIACMDRVLERMDIPRLISAGLTDVGLEDYRHGVAAIIGFGMCYGALPSIVEMDDHSDEIDGATEIAIGSFIEGNLDAKFGAESDQDVFQFIAVPGLVYEMDLDYGDWRLDDFPGDQRPYFAIEVFEPDGWGFSTARPVLWEPSNSGVHYLFVKGAGSFPYEFEISISDYVDDFGNDIETATEIPVGGTVEGTIRQVNEHDYFWFDSEMGVSYQIDVELSDDYLAPDLGPDDLTVTFLDTDRNEIGQISDRRVWEAPTSGEFFLEVTGARYTYQGSYRIAVSESSYRDDHGDDLGSATEITLGKNVAGSLGTDLDADFFYFDAMSGQAYEMSVETDVEGVFYFDLVDPDGDSVSQEQSASTWQAIDDGRYFIRVWSDDIGDYTLSLNTSDYVDDHRDNEATVVLLGQPVEGYILNSSDLDAFSFVGVAGEAYDVEVESGTLNDVVMTLYDSQGTWLNWFDEERFTWQAWESGNYFVYLYSPDGGNYTFTVSKSDYRDDHGDDEEYATALEVSETVSGVIGLDAGYYWESVGNNEGDHDMFSFVAEREQLYSIDVELGSLLRSGIKLSDAAGDIQSSGTTRIVWEAARSGKHYIRVSGLGVGDYELTVARFDYINDHGDDFLSASPIEIGESLSGTIGLEGESDYFRFTSTEGEAYQIDLISDDLQYPWLTLQNTVGEELGSDSSQLKAQAAASKDFFIVVSSLLSTGDYSLSIKLLE